MAVSNSSHTSHTSHTSGLDRDELASFGQGSSIVLSEALQRTMANTLMPKLPDGTTSGPTTSGPTTSAPTTPVPTTPESTTPESTTPGSTTPGSTTSGSTTSGSTTPELTTLQLKARLKPKQRYRTMNAGMRDALLRKQLAKGISVDGDGPIDKNGDRAMEISITTAVLTLNVDRNNTDFWKTEIETLLSQQNIRRDYIPEIVLQQADIFSFLALPLPIGPETHPWLKVLLEAALDIVQDVVAEVKDHFAFPRPFTLAVDLNPVIQTPSHGSFPSGHATQAFCMATILGSLFPDRERQLRAIACRIAVNRGIAGVHFPVDHLAGALLGTVLGAEVVTKVFDWDRIDSKAVPESGVVSFTAGVHDDHDLGDTIEEFAYGQKSPQPSGGVAPVGLNKLMPSGTRELADLRQVADPNSYSVLEWLADEVLTELGA